MFQDSEIARKYACSRGKTTQIIKKSLDAIQQANVKHCQEKHFSLLIDESNDRNFEQCLVMLVRMTEDDKVVTTFLYNYGCC